MSQDIGAIVSERAGARLRNKVVCRGNITIKRNILPPPSHLPYRDLATAFNTTLSLQPFVRSNSALTHESIIRKKEKNERRKEKNKRTKFRPREKGSY
jgi:hypothetical protein